MSKKTRGQLLDKLGTLFGIRTLVYFTDQQLYEADIHLTTCGLCPSPGAKPIGQQCGNNSKGCIIQLSLCLFQSLLVK
jgi:hypothetical protein